MSKIEIENDLQRLIGQQLSSVLVATDYLTLKFVKYPLLEGGRFSDSADIDIEEGFEISDNVEAFTIRNSDGLKEFQMGATHLIALIGEQVSDVKPCPSGELILLFDAKSVRLLLNEFGFDSFNVNFRN